MYKRQENNISSEEYFHYKSIQKGFYIMSNLVKINNTELGIKEFNGQRVITFKDIDRVHNRPDGTARNAFNRNRKRLIKNEDYFIITPVSYTHLDVYKRQVINAEINALQNRINLHVFESYTEIETLHINFFKLIVCQSNSPAKQIT